MRLAATAFLCLALSSAVMINAAAISKNTVQPAQRRVLQSTTVVPATDKRLVYHGRTYNTTQTTVVSFDWACTMVSVTLTGAGKIAGTFDGRGNYFAVSQSHAGGGAPTVTVPRFGTTHGAATYDLGTVDTTTTSGSTGTAGPVTLTLTKISEEQEDTLAAAATPATLLGVCLGGLWAAGAGLYTSAKRRRAARAQKKRTAALASSVPRATVVSTADQLREPLSPPGARCSSESYAFEAVDPASVVVGIPVVGGDGADGDVPIPIAAAASPGAVHRDSLAEGEAREDLPAGGSPPYGYGPRHRRAPYCGGRVRSWCGYFWLCVLGGAFVGGLAGAVLRAVGLRRVRRRGLAAVARGAPSPAGVAFESLALGAGLAVAAPLAPDGSHYAARRLEFVGDSDSNGYCIDGSPDMPWGDYFELPKYQDCSAGYAAQLGRRLGADTHVEAVSGTGCYENGFGISGPVMPALYERTLSSDGSAATAWDWKRWAPGAVVVYLGSNDYANLFGPSDDEFNKAYAALLQDIGDRYAYAASNKKGAAAGPVQIINVCGGPGSARPEPCPLISALSDKFSHAHATSHYIAIPASLGAGEAGCLDHRNRKAQTELADFLEPQIRAITGWAK